ncbi:MAG: FHA domain-containing protein, partial [Acidobacteriota bacterium]|nr:FHA domain-containing protein [Acidobacteriota bacterium]
MKLKLRLERAAGSVDLFVDADASTKVGELARQIWSAGDDTESPPDAEATIALRSGGEISPNGLLVDSGMRSASTIRLVRADTRFTDSSTADAVAVVKVVGGPDEGTEFPLAAGTSLIGRDRSCQVRLTDPMVSRLHARIHVGSSVEMIDLGSAKGLLVGDEASDRVVVSGSDRVRLGDTVLAVAQMIAVHDLAEPLVVAFNRSPRVEPAAPDIAFTAPQPPEPQKVQRFQIVPPFMPLIMGIVLYLSTHNVASLTFIALSPLMMAANSIDNRTVSKRGYEAAVEQFREDLQALSEDIVNAQADEVPERLRDHPGTDECTAAAEQRFPLLWSRWPDLPRILELRLGLGFQPSRVTVDTKIGGGRRHRRGGVGLHRVAGRRLGGQGRAGPQTCPEPSSRTLMRPSESEIPAGRSVPGGSTCRTCLRLA